MANAPGEDSPKKPPGLVAKNGRLYYAIMLHGKVYRGNLNLAGTPHDRTSPETAALIQEQRTLAKYGVSPGNAFAW
jgi:hypothetical protein